MSANSQRYCLDANVLINAWTLYYHKDFVRTIGKYLSAWVMLVGYSWPMR